jgi:hypothetical protein
LRRVEPHERRDQGHQEDLPEDRLADRQQLPQVGRGLEVAAGAERRDAGRLKYMKLVVGSWPKKRRSTALIVRNTKVNVNAISR